jgi:hypothetical protein
MSSASAWTRPAGPRCSRNGPFRYLLEFNAGITKKCPHGD